METPKVTTIEVIEGWINANHHDLYSKAEYIATLQRIVDRLKEEEQEREENTVSAHSLIESNIERYTNRIASVMDFDQDIELSLNRNEIELSINEESIVRQVLDSLLENME